MTKVTIHMVASLDGYIAHKEGSLSWLESSDYYEAGHTLSEEEIATYLAKIDCYLMGSHTYEAALEHGWPYGTHPVTVLTRRGLTTERSNVDFYSGDLSALIRQQLGLRYENIWAVGGAKLTKKLLQLDLADEIIISIMPVLLGDGTLFFDVIGVEKRLHLKEVKAYKDGMVELKYAIRKES